MAEHKEVVPTSPVPFGGSDEISGAAPEASPEAVENGPKTNSAATGAAQSTPDHEAMRQAVLRWSEEEKKAIALQSQRIAIARDAQAHWEQVTRFRFAATLATLAFGMGFCLTLGFVIRSLYPHGIKLFAAAPVAPDTAVANPAVPAPPSTPDVIAPPLTSTSTAAPPTEDAASSPESLAKEYIAQLLQHPIDPIFSEVHSELDTVTGQTVVTGMIDCPDKGERSLYAGRFRRSRSIWPQPFCAILCRVEGVPMLRFAYVGSGQNGGLANYESTVPPGELRESSTPRDRYVLVVNVLRRYLESPDVPQTNRVDVQAKVRAFEVTAPEPDYVAPWDEMDVARFRVTPL